MVWYIFKNISVSIKCMHVLSGCVCRWPLMPLCSQHRLKVTHTHLKRPHLQFAHKKILNKQNSLQSILFPQEYALECSSCNFSYPPPPWRSTQSNSMWQYFFECLRNPTHNENFDLSASEVQNFMPASPTPYRFRIWYEQKAEAQ